MSEEQEIEMGNIDIESTQVHDQEADGMEFENFEYENTSAGGFYLETLDNDVLVRELVSEVLMSFFPN